MDISPVVEGPEKLLPNTTNSLVMSTKIKVAVALFAIALIYFVVIRD